MTTAQELRERAKAKQASKPAPASKDERERERAEERAVALEFMGETAPDELVVVFRGSGDKPTTYGKQTVNPKVFSSGNVGYYGGGTVLTIGGEEYRIVNITLVKK